MKMKRKNRLQGIMRIDERLEMKNYNMILIEKQQKY